MASNKEEHAAYEMQIFRSAAYFTVVRPGFAKKEFTDFAEGALLTASAPRALLYAVTGPGRSVVLIRERWAEYLEAWRHDKGLNVKVGDEVYHIDPRHVGTVKKFYQAGVVQIEWENGWVSYLMAAELTKV